MGAGFPGRGPRGRRSRSGDKADRARQPPRRAGPELRRLLAGRPTGGRSSRPRQEKVVSMSAVAACTLQRCARAWLGQRRAVAARALVIECVELVPAVEPQPKVPNKPLKKARAKMVKQQKYQDDENKSDEAIRQTEAEAAEMAHLKVDLMAPQRTLMDIMVQKVK